MNNIQELIERLTDMCATEEGSPWPHDVMQCLIDCRSLLQAPLPDDVKAMIDYQNSVALVYGNERDRGIGDMLERLWRENEEYARRDILLSDDNTELQQRIEELEETLSKTQNRNIEAERLDAALAEAIDLMEDTITGDYKPDSFTTQPWKKARAGE